MKDTGGNAFPTTWQDLLNGEVAVFPHPGMTLRDYFAANAMVAATHTDTWTGEMADLARDAYQIADAMIKERKK